MGLEGIAIAAGVVLLVVIVIPAFARGRTAAAQAPADERFAPNLRILRARSYSHAHNTSDDRCTLYSTERRMKNTQTQKPNKSVGEQHTHVRTLARQRSHARASIAARRALRIRFGIGAAVLVALTTILWVLVGSVNLSLVAPIAASVVLALYAASFIYLLRLWYQMDVEDSRTISRTQAAFGSMRTQGKSRERNKKASARVHHTLEPERSTAEESRITSSEIASDPSHAERSSQPYSKKTADRIDPVKAEEYAAAKPTERAAEQEEGTAGPVPQTSQRAARATQPAAILVPSYTLKPARKRNERTRSDENHASDAGFNARTREVEPYTPPAMGEASVPFRPQYKGERVGELAPEPPLQVPSHATEAPVRHSRTDVLGVGDALDSLLDRRRA